MIGVIFSFSNEVVETRVNGNQVFFRTGSSPQFADISGIKLSKPGVIKEFPDLKDKDDWRRQAQNRFKEKVRSMKDEKEIVEYLIKDLTKFGYQARYIQKQGHRPVKIQ